MIVITELIVENISLNIEHRAILESQSFCLSSGKALGITGANGAGKTMILKICAGVLTPSTGTVHYLKDKKLIRAENARGHIGMVLGSPVFYPGQSCREVVRFHAAHFDGKSEVDVTLKMFGLEQVLDASHEKLSLGQRMRLALARAWITNPDVLILDEPDNALDDVAMNILLQEINKKLDSGRICILATHNKDLLKKMANDNRWDFLHLEKNI
ncbi:ABC transporter ATP-binding protein [Corynebacterium sp. sy017]|nr:ABC transporter ATP-binding protein [Corynebacterium sp. sy017]TSD92120.1 ABC transporter ATP-binding protein [Corynebacterium sp. SY003]